MSDIPSLPWGLGILSMESCKHIELFHSLNFYVHMYKLVGLVPKMNIIDPKLV